MIELEIQTLSQTRDGLLIEVGRAVTAAGFTLVRQRLNDDPHGALMTMVVRGPPRRQRALEDTLDGFERIISFEISPFVAGEVKPHFAASRPNSTASARPASITPRQAAAEEPVPVAPVAAVPGPVASEPATAGPITPDRPITAPHAAIAALANAALADESAMEEPPQEGPPLPASPARKQAVEPEPSCDLILPTPGTPSAPPVAAPAPFVEITPLEADALAVDEALAGLSRDYPQVIPHLLAMDGKVEPGARASSLALAGRRMGAWVFQRDYATLAPLGLPQAIAAIAIPALRALVEAEQRGVQVHIHRSPLCTRDDHSGCSFYGGYLEGLLGRALGSEALTIFPVCCRSYGADDCVLDLSD